MMKRILHSWSFHMIFMKFAEGSFHFCKILNIFKVQYIFRCLPMSNDVEIACGSKSGQLIFVSFITGD